MKLIDIVSLSESVSFFVDMHDENEEFKDVLSICSYAARIFYKRMKDQYPFFEKYILDQREKGKFAHITFDPDGDDYDKKTGTINVYPGGAVNDRFYKNFLDLIDYTVDKLGEKVKVGKLTKEGTKNEYDTPRNKFDDGESADKLGVIRIPIVANEVDAPKFNEMNVANDNARSLLKTLGLDTTELVGEIPYKEIPRLMMKIRNLSSGAIDSATREPTDSQSTRVDRSGDLPSIQKGARIHDMGLSAPRMNSYLENLLVILQQAYDNKANVNYG